MKQLLLISGFYFSCLYTQAQQIFISTGKIEFEKQINLHRELDQSWSSDDDNIWKNDFKKSIPKIQSTYYDLYFNQNKSIYKAGREVQNTQKIPDWLGDNGTENIVCNDLENKKTISEKHVFESVFLVNDSLRKIDWKITNDTRLIAGIECRKAVAIVMDSVYVIAFYTDIITVSGGPESFTGLPGMILGVAVPRINTTWFATKIEVKPFDEKVFTEPKKGKKNTYAELLNQLKGISDNWRGSADKIIWKTML